MKHFNIDFLVDVSIGIFYFFLFASLSLVVFLIKLCVDDCAKGSVIEESESSEDFDPL